MGKTGIWPDIDPSDFDLGSYSVEVFTCIPIYEDAMERESITKEVHWSASTETSSLEELVSH